MSRTNIPAVMTVRAARTLSLLTCIVLIGACSPRTSLTPGQQARYDRGHESFDFLYGSITGVVVTSPSVVDELKRDNSLRDDEEFTFYVPTIQQLGLAESTLLEMHEAVAASGIASLPPRDRPWLKDAECNLQMWESYLRTYVGLRRQDKDYMLCHFMHPDDVFALDDMCGFEDSWKRVFGFPSSTIEPCAGTFMMLVNVTDTQIYTEFDSEFLQAWYASRAEEAAER